MEANTEMSARELAGGAGRTFAQRVKRFSMRSLLVLMTLSCLALGVWSAYVKPYGDQQAAIRLINDRQGRTVVEAAEGPRWQQRLVTTMHGPDSFVRAVVVDLNRSEISDADARVLASLSFLRELNLDRSTISADGLAALGRVCLIAFAHEARLVSMVLTALAALSMIVGSIVAVSQTDMKRLLAYSSIAHAGYALLGYVAATSEPGSLSGAPATLTYAFLYVFMTLGAFGVVVALGERGESVDGYQGVAAQRPAAALLMLLFLLSLTGIPPTAGFVAKFVVIMSVVHAGHMWLAVLAVLCSVNGRLGSPSHKFYAPRTMIATPMVQRLMMAMTHCV